MSELYRIADIEVDTTLFQVRRRGEIVPVQPQVFDVLLYLLKHRERLVSKDELLDQVWHDRVISETTLSSRIKAVRKLLGDSGDKQQLIRTVRNRGYQFVGDVQVKLKDARALAAPTGAGRFDGVTSVAVLPFETPGAGRQDDYLGQGLAADIIGLLARHRRLRVISRGSSFAFSQSANSVHEIGTALDVRYLLMGRISHGRGKLRIDAELADCETDTHLWSRRYDIDESDLFTVQEDISRHIAAAIEPELTVIEGERAAAMQGADLDAWGCCYRGYSHLYRFNVDDLYLARQRFEDALQIDPELAFAHGGLAYATVQLAFYGAHERRTVELDTALEHAREAVELEPRDAFGHFVIGRTYSLLQRFPEANAALEQSIDMSPSFAQAYFALGFSHTNSGRPAEAVPLYEAAENLSPRDPHLWTFHHMRAMAHFRLGELEDAERYIRLSVAQPNATYWPFATLCALLADTQRVHEAKAIGDRLMKMMPKYSLSFALDDFFFTPQDGFVERYVEALSMAGIPQG